MVYSRAFSGHMAGEQPGDAAAYDLRSVALIFYRTKAISVNKMAVNRNTRHKICYTFIGTGHAPCLPTIRNGGTAMDKNTRFVEQKRLERVQKALEKNRMEAYIVADASEVVPLLRSLLHNNDTVTCGGSRTLFECGIIDMLLEGPYDYLDRYAPGADTAAVYRQAFSADAYLASANAVTESGEIFQVDGTGNRVAALAFGPSNVILVVGQNKIVPDIEAARRRNAEIAAPANAVRVDAKTPCAATGKCNDCSSPDRICSTELVLRQQRIQGRIKVILVPEELGY